jgi:WD40 repeat protein
MKRLCSSAFLRWRLCGAALLLLSGSASAESPRTDRLGDPLPEGAIARLGTMRLCHDAPIAAVAFAPDGKTLASGDEYGIIRIWEPASGRAVRCLRGEPNTICALAYSADGKQLACVAENGVYMWDAATGTAPARLGEGCRDKASPAFAPNGKALLTVMNDDLIRWDLSADGRLSEFQRTYHHQKDTQAAVWSPDGKRIVFASDKGVRVYDAATVKEIRKLSGLVASSLAYAPDGKRLAVGVADSCLVLDAVTGDEILSIRKAARFLAYSPDGRTVAGLPRFGRTPWLLDVPQRKVRWADSDEDAKELKALAFSPDGKMLATGGDDQRVRLWDIAAGKECDVLNGEASSQRLFAVSGNGKVLAALDDNRRIRIWDTDSGKQRRRWDITAPSFPGLSLSSDGALLAVRGTSGQSEETIQVFDAATGRRLWGDKASKFIGFAFDELRQIVEQFGALNAAGTPPGGESIARRGDGDACFLDAARGKNAENFTLAGRTAALEACAVGRLPASGDKVPSGHGGGHGMAPPEQQWLTTDDRAEGMLGEVTQRSIVTSSL